MSCKFLHDGREFNSIEEIEAYVAENAANDENVFYQAADTETGPKASDAVVKKVREFLKRIGVNINNVREIVDFKGTVINANAQADLLKNIIDLVEGKEDVAITEEAMHFAVEIIEQTNPKLFNEMMNKVGTYNIWEQVLSSPVYRKQYTMPDGTLNIRMLKKEAVGKVLAATFLSIEDQTMEKPEKIAQAKTWIQRIKEFFKQLFQKAEFNPFEEAAKSLDTLDSVETAKRKEELAKEVAQLDAKGIFASIFKSSVESGDYNDALALYAQQLMDPLTYDTTVNNFLEGNHDIAKRILELATPMLQNTTSTKADEIYNKLLSSHQKITLTQGTTQSGDSYYSIDGKKIKNRVTDKVKSFYEKAFRGNQLGKTELQESIDTQKKDKGTAGHADMEALFHRYVDDNGYKRTTPLEMPTSQLDPNNSKYIETLDRYMKDLIESYPDGSRFLAETRIYSAAKDQAGTMDFVAILPEGKVDIRDWKFMDIYKEATDVPWYKKEAFNIQLSEYKDMLKKNYGVNSFRYTRAIPIKTTYGFEDFNKKDKLKLKGLTIGNLDTTKITDLTLLPVATRDETTGDVSIDNYIKRLNALYDKLKKEKVSEGRRDIKRDKLNSLERAIRILQLQKGNKELRIAATSITAAVARDLERYKNLLAENPNPSKAMVNEISQRILDDYDIVELFVGIDRVFRGLELDPKDQEALKNISNTAGDIIADIGQEGGLRQQVADIIANGYSIKDLLNPEKVVPYIARNFRSLSQAGTAATRVLWKMQERIKTAIAIEHDEEITKLAKLKEDLEKAGNPSELLKKMLAYDSKKRWTGKLIGRINPEFYKKLKEAQKNGDSKWIKDNIDVDAYNQWYAKRIAEQTVYEQNQTYDYENEEENKAEKQRRIDKYIKTYNINQDSGISPANDRLVSFPKTDTWKSTAFAEVERTPALLAFYNYWEEKMKESLKSGMIQGAGYARFVPNVRRNRLEKQFEGVGKGKAKHLTFFNDMLADPEDVAVDPLTGKPVDYIAPLYLNDLGQQATDDKGEEYRDYSQKSDDLFKIMGLWTAEMSKFKYRTQIENEAKVIQAVEKAKSHLIINKRNKTTTVAPGNDTNSQYFDNFMNSLLYGRKYTEQSDATTTINVNNYIRGINKGIKKVIGIEPIPLASDDELELSGTKTIEKLNRYFQLKTMGLHIPAAITNFLGGTTNAYINSGKDILKKDLLHGEALFASSKFQSPEGKKYAAALSYFLPLTESEMKDKSHGLSVKGHIANLSSDVLWYFQRFSDRAVQIPIFFAFADNTMVENGELVNIRRFVRAKNDYANKYKLSRVERDQLDSKIEKEIEELKSTRSLSKIIQIVDDKAVIPGIDRASDTVSAFRNQVQQFSKDALGNMEPEDVYQYRMNLLAKSMMMFKNWIPRMADVRFGGLRYEVGKDEWEWGRINMLWNGLAHNLFNATASFVGIASGEENLIAKAKSVYAIKQSEIGEDKFMTEAEFVDMYLRAANQTVSEILCFASLMGMWVGLGAAVPDDDDEVTKGAHKWALRLIDRGVDELSFFYNPQSMADIANGSVFPALGAVLDLQKFAINAGKETFYTVTGNEEGSKKTHTLKHLMKAIPVTKEFSTYLGIFSKEWAEELGIQVSNQARPNR